MDTPTVRETDAGAANTGAARQNAVLAQLPATAPDATTTGAGSQRLPSRTGARAAAAQVAGIPGHEDGLDLRWRAEPVMAALDVPAVPGSQGGSAGTDGPG